MQAWKESAWLQPPALSSVPTAQHPTILLLPPTPAYPPPGHGSCLYLVPAPTPVPASAPTNLLQQQTLLFPQVGLPRTKNLPSPSSSCSVPRVSPCPLPSPCPTAIAQHQLVPILIAKAQHLIHLATVISDYVRFPPWNLPRILETPFHRWQSIPHLPEPGRKPIASPALLLCTPGDSTRFLSGAQLCPTLCHSMDCSSPGS